MAEGGFSSRDFSDVSSTLLGKRIVELSCYHAILQRLGVRLYTDIRGVEGNWERLAEELGFLTYNEVENIHRHASLEKIFPGSVLLKRWGDNPGSTVYVLLQALKKLGRIDCVDDVCKFLQDENNMELHVSIENETGIKEFITVPTKKDASLGSSLENALGTLICFNIIGPNSDTDWQTTAIELKGKQLSLKKIPVSDSKRDSIYQNRQYVNTNLPIESSGPSYPANIPLDSASLNLPTLTSTPQNLLTYGPETNVFLSNTFSSVTKEKQFETGSNKPTDSDYNDGSCRRVLKHSKSIEDSNFSSLTSVKKFEKSLIQDLDNTGLKKCNSLSDIPLFEPLKKSDSVTSMDTSELSTTCHFHCGAEKCTHSLIWEDGEMKFSNQGFEALDISMDSGDVLEICTPPSGCSPVDDYIPHSFVVSRRHSNESSTSASPVTSPSQTIEQFSPSSPNTSGATHKPVGDNKSQSLLRTALRRSFEKKASEGAEVPAPKPCKKIQPQQNEIYLGATHKDSATDSVVDIEDELSKRPPQCRLPVAADGYIDMNTSVSESNVRPKSLPLDSNQMYMNIARRPLPPRPKSDTASNHLIHSKSAGDMYVLNSNNNEYCVIDENKPTNIGLNQSPPLPHKRIQTQPIPIQRSQSTTCVPDLTNVPGWCSSVTEASITTKMNKYKNEDGNFMVWKMKNNTFVITVSHLRDLRHYAIHSRNINGQVNYFIFNGGFMTTSILELVNHYQKEGLKGPDPMLDGGRGKKWQKFSHVKLKNPMQSRLLSPKS